MLSTKINISLAPTQTLQGVEFAVSEDGQTVAISQRGLAKLCGVNQSNVQRRLHKIANQTSDAQEPSKTAETLALLSSGLIPSMVAVAILDYYAFDSDAANDTAQLTE